MDIPDGSTRREIVRYDLGREKGRAWAMEAVEGRPHEVLALQGFFASHPSSLGWVRQEVWPGWSHWSIVAAIVSGLDLDDPLDPEEVDDAVRMLNRSLGESSVDGAVDGRFIAGFIEGVRRSYSGLPRGGIQP